MEKGIEKSRGYEIEKRVKRGKVGHGEHQKLAYMKKFFLGDVVSLLVLKGCGMVRREASEPLRR